MKTVRVQPKNFFINVRGLVLIYFLLCVLTILFSRIFFLETLEEGSLPGPLPFIVFFTVPVVLLVFLGFSVANLVRDFIARRVGSKFQARLFGYFIVTVIFAAVPVTLITTQSVYVMVRFWQSMHLEKALNDAGALAMENYSLQLEKCDGLIQERQNDIGILMRSWDDLGDGTDWREELPRGIHRHIGVDEMGDLGEDFAAVQEFWLIPGGVWRKGTFAGNVDLELEGPPALQRGFAPREMPRDQDVIRYVLHPPLPPNRGNFTGLIRVISYELGAGFDDTVEAIGNELVRFDLIDRLGSNMRPLLIFYYMMFFFPTKKLHPPISK